jgi:hypothetical protein
MPPGHRRKKIDRSKLRDRRSSREDGRLSTDKRFPLAWQTWTKSGTDLRAARDRSRPEAAVWLECQAFTEHSAKLGANGGAFEQLGGSFEPPEKDIQPVTALKMAAFSRRPLRFGSGPHRRAWRSVSRRFLYLDQLAGIEAV